MRDSFSVMRNSEPRIGPSSAVSQERDKWSYLEAKMVELPAKTLVGLAAVNTSTRQFAPHFDEFRIFREVIEQVPQKNAR